MNPIQGKSFFCSWSGGKDSCLALHRALKNGGKSGFLLSMFREDGQRSHSHGLPSTVIQRQADALHIPLIVRNTSWSDYTSIFTATLYQLKQQGIQVGVFGDIDIEEHRQWCQEVCHETGLLAYHPLWERPRNDLLDEFFTLQFKATIVSLKADYIAKGWLGKQLTRNIVGQMEDCGIDPSGENGEYHTVVTDGPLFSEKIDFRVNKQEFHDGYWFLDIS